MQVKIHKSTFLSQQKRDVFVFGDESFFKRVQKIVEPLGFIKLCDLNQIKKQHLNIYFLIAEADFTNTEKLSVLTKYFRGYNEQLAHKILLMSQPEKICQEYLLFSVEVGSRFIAHGPSKDRELSLYLKRISSESEQIGTVVHSEAEMNRYLANNDLNALNLLDGKLADLDRNNEEILRLRVIINTRLCRAKRVESFLKRLLILNPQNLWAANELGRFYIQRRRASEGLAILEKLSRFHDLNCERFIDMGEAYLNLGDAKNAEKSFQRGENLIGVFEPRLAEGKAKVKLLEGNVQEAMKLLKQNVLNAQIISFLNMRGIMAIRTKNLREGLNLYQMALSNCVDNNVIKAKLNFNLGLGLVKSSQANEALAYFQKSIELGGDFFTKGKRLLEVSKKLAASGTGNVSAGLSTADSKEEEIEFEYEHFGAFSSKQ